MAGRIVSSLAAFLTLTIIGLGMQHVLPPLVDNYSIFWWINWIWSWFLTANVAFNFVLCLITPPGPVPRLSADEWKTSSGLTDPESGDAGGPVPKGRWCSICNNAKPDGAHHCSTCRTCVGGMDHHCVFINNCVGWNNQAIFMRYLFWVSLSTLYVSLLCVVYYFTLGVKFRFHASVPAVPQTAAGTWGAWTARVFRPLVGVWTFFMHFTEEQDEIIVVEMMLSAGVMIAVGSLFCIQLRNIYYGTTTIDETIDILQEVHQSSSSHPVGVPPAVGSQSSPPSREEHLSLLERWWVLTGRLRITMGVEESKLWWVVCWLPSLSQPKTFPEKRR